MVSSTNCSFIKSCQIVQQAARRSRHGQLSQRGRVTAIAANRPEKRMPVDVLAERLLSEESRDDKTPLDLFLAGVPRWDRCVERLLRAA